MEKERKQDNLDFETLENVNGGTITLSNPPVAAGANPGEADMMDPPPYGN